MDSNGLRYRTTLDSSKGNAVPFRVRKFRKLIYWVREWIASALRGASPRVEGHSIISLNQLMTLGR